MEFESEKERKLNVKMMACGCLNTERLAGILAYRAAISESRITMSEIKPVERPPLFSDEDSEPFDEAAERVKFEAWYTSCKSNLSRDYAGDYISELAAAQWCGWLARAKLGSGVK